MDLTIFTLRPGNDLVLIPLEHNDVGVPEGSAADGCIGVIRHTVEVTKHDMVRNDIGQRIGVLWDTTLNFVNYRHKN